MKLNRSLLHSPKFQKLLIVCEDRHRAIGILADLYILAKFYWKNPIPQADLLDAEIPIELLNRLGFLVKEPEGYYMAGSADAFARLTPQELGKLSAESENHHDLRDENGLFIPKHVWDQMTASEKKALQKRKDAKKNAREKARIEKAEKRAIREAKKKAEAEIRALKKKTKKAKSKKTGELNAKGRALKPKAVAKMSPKKEVSKLRKTKKVNTSGRAPKGAQ